MKNITIYTTPTCQYCGMAKEYFIDQGIKYTEKDVSTDQAAAREMIDKTNQMGVPVIAISDQEGGEEQLIVGFDQERIKGILGVTENS